MTDDYDAAVLSDRNDREVIPAKLRAKQSPNWDATASAAEAGMRLIERSTVLLSAPDREELDQAYRQLRLLHGEGSAGIRPTSPAWNG